MRHQACPQDIGQLRQYLKDNGKSPEQYVVGKFQKYDLVFLGEWHRFSHDVKLVRDLIPLLYKAGVRRLGSEFALSEDQAEMDRLVTAPEYDENLARRLQFRQFAAWAYRDYLDIYRAAWELNRSLPRGAAPFRIVGLNYRPAWPLLTAERNPEIMRKVWHKGDPDAYMAGVILKEFVDKGLKALIYCGAHHAFTGYHQPVYDFQTKKLHRLNKERAGNLVHAKVPDRVFNIHLHGPWMTRESANSFLPPAGGVIDEVMRGFQDQRVGFDVKGGPFGELGDQSSYYSVGYDSFRLQVFCDGWIYQKPFSQYEGVKVDPLFVTEQNFQEALENLPNPEARQRIKTPQQMLEAFRQETDIPARFRRMKLIPEK